MQSNIFIPNKINVGFRNREDTYTKKLAYVIYYDEKGKLRKEASWNSWRDKTIPNEEFDNEPTSGFVLNKKAGGYSTGWNHRQTYVRVYDPRGFEFEIDITNLLYILENTNSIKGKGLEGEFIYGWDGKELVLMPTDSPDYVEISNYNKIVHSNFKLKGKDLKLGATYLTKDNEEWIYLGRFDKWETDYNNKYKDENGYTIYPYVTKGKAYFFKYCSSYSDRIKPIKSLNKFIGVISEDCVDNYAELMDKLESNTYYSPIDRNKDEYLPYTITEFKEKFNDEHFYNVSFYDNSKKNITIRKEYQGNRYYSEYKVDYSKESYFGRSYSDWRWEKEYFNSIEDIFDKYKPMYKNTYLKNGKLYSEGK